MQEVDKPRASLVPGMLKELEGALLGSNGLAHRSPLSRADEAIFSSKFESRRNFIMGDSNFYFAANLMDPHLRGAGLSSEEVIKGTQGFEIVNA